MGVLAGPADARSHFARIGDSWGIATASSLPDLIAVPMLGGEQQLLLRFGADGRVEQVRIREHAFDRVAMRAPRGARPGDAPTGRRSRAPPPV